MVSRSADPHVKGDPVGLRDAWFFLCALCVSVVQAGFSE